ncbi:MAG: primosomal protein N' [Acholeplasmataceae bacterium]
MFASIIVDIKNKDVNRQFDYIIPIEYEYIIKRGMRVVVPFGEQVRMGFVISIFDMSEQAKKAIIDVLDVIPTIDEETFEIIDYLYQTTHQVYASIFDTVVPSQINLKYEKLITLKNDDLVDEDFKQLFNSKKQFSISKSNQTYDYKIRKYLALDAISVTQIYHQKTTDKFVTLYKLNKNHQYTKIDRYMDILNLLNDEAYDKQQLLDFGLSVSNIQTLIKHDVFIAFKSKVIREVKHVFDLKDKSIILTKAQNDVYETIKKSYDSNQKFLLKGVTGSGKTEIYLNIISDMIHKNKQVLCLVPEITLIAPMAQRLKSRFEGVTIYHSGLSSGEQLDAYMQIKDGNASILLGTRSSVFLPFNDLGCIIIDESHDQSYIQTERVIYDAIDIAKLRATYHHIPLILGSATPKVSRYYEALNHQYQLLTLNERPFGIKQPKLIFVDMKKELLEGNTSMFSTVLQKGILERLEKKEQVMILFNRKGYAPFVMCRNCGYVPSCPNCGIALTYYKEDQSLKCHYCGHQEPYKDICDVCHSKQIKEVGVGIEQVERALRKTFFNAKILRMDANVTKTKGSHELIWNQFNETDADILLGTQMIAKGLDFPKVTLVGVLMADLLLKIPTYQASEQAYTLLTQVSGRSGRFLPGEVIIQGYDLNHYAIEQVSKPYEAFYEKAIFDRKISRYEPFVNVSQILFEGQEYLKTYQQAFKLKKMIEKEDKDVYILGPVSAYIKKYHEKYRFIMTLKYEKKLAYLFNFIEQLETKDITIKYYPNQEIQ